MALDAPGHRRPQRAYVQGVLAIGLLSPTPARMAQQIYAHCRQPVGPEAASLPCDRSADALLQLRIPAGASGHGHRKGGGAALQHHAARPIHEVQAAQAQPRQLTRRPGMAVGGIPQGDVDHARPKRRVAIQQVELLAGAQLGQQRLGAGLWISGWQGWAHHDLVTPLARAWHWVGPLILRPNRESWLIAI